MTLSITQRARLHHQGITVLIEYGNQTVKCMTRDGERFYTAQDLKEISKPGFADRLTAMIGRGEVNRR